MSATTAPPASAEDGAGPKDEVLLAVRGLRTYYSIRGSFFDRLVGREAGRVKAVDDITFDLRKGEVLGLVGESGSGKTTLGRTLLGLVRATSGEVMFEGRDITKLKEREFRAHRRRMQIVFQDPHASLNPAMTIGQSVGHPLKIHKLASDGDQLKTRVSAALEIVGLAPAEQFMDKYPSDLSGGQKQRAVIARSIILNPVLLVCDEPVSMLDMSVRAKILQLMLDLKREFDLTYLYITHDLATAKFFCDRIAIMYLGRIVEMGPSEAIYEDPKHPYTKALLRAIPEPDPRRTIPRDLPRGEVPDAARPPLGCSFHPRCPSAFEVCGWEGRDLRDLLEVHWAHLGEEQYESELRAIGDLSALAVPGKSVHLSGTGASRVLETFRAEAPDDPLWRGVKSVRASADGQVDLEFHESMEPRRVQVGDVQVECHLYDEEALRRAEELRASTGATSDDGS